MVTNDSLTSIGMLRYTKPMHKAKSYRREAEWTAIEVSGTFAS
ncbi:MAG: hypothetical protein RI957_908 [Verrucomicrobiota bacterium]|jgi:hypothetical protein